MIVAEPRLAIMFDPMGIKALRTDALIGALDPVALPAALAGVIGAYLPCLAALFSGLVSAASFRPAFVSTARAKTRRRASLEGGPTLFAVVMEIHLACR